MRKGKREPLARAGELFARLPVVLVIDQIG